MFRYTRRILPALALILCVGGAIQLGSPLMPGGDPAVATADSTASARQTTESTADRRDVTAATRYGGDISESVVAQGPRQSASAPLPPADDSNDDPQSEEDEDKTRAAARAKMSAPVAALAETGGADPVELVISYETHPELFDAERVEELGGEVLRAYNVLDVQTIRLPAEALYDLAIEPNVDRLSLDEEITSTSLPASQKRGKAKGSRDAAGLPAPSSPNAIYSGNGIGVAVLDTGVSDHGDLAGNVIQYSFLNGAYPVPEIVDGQLVTYNDNPREDLFGHGTHVAGIIAGSGGASGSDFRGSATNVSILSLQVLDGHGNGSMSNVMAALDWLLQYGQHFNVRIANLSLGKGISESNETDPLVHAVDALWSQGVVVVAAAGNLGTGGALTVKSPGNSRKIITVGSLTDAGTADYADDYISSYSSRGPSIGDFIMKPDLVAPGNRIVATIPQQAKLRDDMQDRLIEDACLIDSPDSVSCADAYLELSGTSMATPLVAAAVALMLDKDSSLNPATVKARLMRSARKIAANPIDAGAGVLDIEAALNDTGVVTGEALSPRLLVDEVNEGYLIEDTAALWGSGWSAHGVWADGGLWSADPNAVEGDLLWADRNLWADSNLWADRNMWADSNLWADGNLWADSNLWADGNLWADSVSDADPLYDPQNPANVLADDPDTTE
jgi:serine protease AprX